LKNKDFFLEKKIFIEIKNLGWLVGIIIQSHQKVKDVTDGGEAVNNTL
jgi:hypothetical protein